MAHNNNNTFAPRNALHAPDLLQHHKCIASNRLNHPLLAGLNFPSTRRKSPTESVERKCLTSAVGLAALVTDSKDVDHGSGRLLKLASDVLKTMPTRRAAAH
eukprot:7164871-Pyramimonas_sp.AAC.1